MPGHALCASGLAPLRDRLRDVDDHMVDLIERSAEVRSMQTEVGERASRVRPGTQDVPWSSWTLDWDTASASAWRVGYWPSTGSACMFEPTRRSYGVKMRRLGVILVHRCADSAGFACIFEPTRRQRAR